MASETPPPAKKSKAPKKSKKRKKVVEVEEEEEDEEEDEDDDEPEAWVAGDHPERVTVIGSGPAGLSAAIYAARAGLRPVVVAPAFGGQLMGKGVDVENYPGLLMQTGPGVVMLMKEQAASFGTVFEEQLVTSVDLSTSPYTVHTNRSKIQTHSIIVATGADSRWLWVTGEQALRGGGVSACATCDGFLFRDQHVFVVGGGDTAMEDALVLARTSSKVTVVHRRDSFRASAVLATRVLNHEKITVMWNSTVVEFIGNEDEEHPRLTHVVVKNLNTGESQEVAAAAAFVAIGHEPNTLLFKGNLNMTSSGYLDTYHHSTATSAEGVFAAGDVADHVYRQAITSAGSGAMASLDAERWLSMKGLGEEKPNGGAGDESDALMAELMADFALMADEGESVNIYDDAESIKEGVVGRKESLAAAEDDARDNTSSEDSGDDEELLQWAADSSAHGSGSAGYKEL
mmetsp:Transcript_51771/g.70604  ORF Transcript_51771/g.70604 Transcript_51771/m.70604 type:complete len:458 (-) Transcript_51771:281-1654(-)